MNVNRRNFLLGSAAAARVVYGQSEQVVKTAVIGTGNRGSYLLQSVLAQSNTKVVALCDNKPDRLDKAASAAAKDNPATYADWRRVIDLKDVEAVFIATPPYLHSEMAIAALQAGKNVYCEKPIGVNGQQVRDLVKVAKSTNKVFVAGQQLRSMKTLGEAVRKIREGAIGDVIMVKAQREATSDLNHAGSSADWYFDVTKSGGYLIEQSVHNLDACNWAAGAHPVRCCGFGGILLFKNDPPGRTIYDCSCLTYEYPSGAKLAFTQNVFHPPTMPNRDQNIYVYGTTGSAGDLLAAPELYPLSRDGKPSVFAEKQKDPPHAHTVAFYDCITKGGPNPADITAGATAALTAVMGHEAMSQGKIINWSDYGVDL